MSKKTAPKKSAKKSAKPAQAKSAPKKVLPAAKKAAVGKKTPPAKKAAAVSAAKNGAAAPARRVIASVKPDKLAKLRESVNAKAQPKRIAQATISAPKPAAPRARVQQRRVYLRLIAAVLLKIPLVYPGARGDLSNRPHPARLRDLYVRSH